jgi:ring-1,2-phenylacetyl-CoA epoxidase subunit PaaD
MTDELLHIDQKIIEILKTVSDPEIPVLSIVDMGVVRAAK